MKASFLCNLITSISKFPEQKLSIAKQSLNYCFCEILVHPLAYLQLYIFKQY